MNTSLGSESKPCIKQTQEPGSISPETSVNICQTTRPHIRKDTTLHTQRCETSVPPIFRPFFILKDATLYHWLKRSRADF
jgi:hypothetical protein